MPSRRRKKRRASDDGPTDWAIDPDNLEYEYVNLPNLAYKWGRRRVEAKAKLAQLKLQEKRLYAELFTLMMDEIQAATGKKPSIETVKNAVLQSPDYIRLLEEVAAAQEAVEEMSMMQEVLAYKKDMLVSLGADRRAAGQAEIKI